MSKKSLWRRAKPYNVGVLEDGAPMLLEVVDGV
jgi:hypothetical protein